MTLIVTVEPAAKVAPLAGLVMLTAGNTLATTDTLTGGVEVVEAPLLSVATTVRE